MRYIIISLAQTAGVILLAVSGVLIGMRFWRVKSRVWIVAYAVPLAIVAMIGISRWVLRAELVPPFKWIMSGRTEFVVTAIVITMLLTTPLSRLPQKRNRRAVVVLMILATVYFSVLPILFPVFEYSHMVDLVTILDSDDVCIQSTHYNCGPAAAVTVLRRISVPAKEGELALSSYTTRITGTPMDILRNAIRKNYGVPCRIVYCRDVSDLQDKTPFIAIIKYGFMIDHYVAVMSISETEVTLGDPLEGVRTCTPEEFEKEWRGCAIVIERPAQIKGKEYQE